MRDHQNIRPFNMGFVTLFINERHAAKPIFFLTDKPDNILIYNPYETRVSSNTKVLTSLKL
jgi:hypothetical protein